MLTISLDSESYYDDEVSVKPLGYYKYARHPRADLYMVSVCDGAEVWAGHPRDFNWDALNGVRLLNHNKAHDEEMIIAGQERGEIPKFIPSEWHCTANMSSFLWNQRSLAGAMKEGFGVDVDKGVRDKAKGKTWLDMVKEGWAGDMLKYARSDAQHPHMMWSKYAHLWPEWERRLSNLTITQGRYGVAIDTKRLAHYIEVLNKIIFTATNNLPWIARGRKPGSTIGIAEECRSSGIPGQPVKADDEEAAEEWEETYSPRFPWVMALRNLRKAKKTLAFLETMTQRIREDSTTAFSLKYFGGHCLPGDHEVLTESGWVRLDAWKGGRLAQRDTEGRVVFEEAIPNRFDGVAESLLSCNTGQVNFSVTEGHWVATLNKKNELIKRQAAELCGKTFTLPISGARAWRGTERAVADQIRLRVAVQADGHYLTDCRSIRFRFTRTRKIERLTRLLIRNDVAFKKCVYPSEPDVTVFTLPGFPEWLDGAKTFGPEILKYNQRDLLVFINEIVHWDGTQSGPNSFTYTTTNKNNAEWVQTAAHLCGKSALVGRTERTNQNWSDSYNVSVRNYSNTRVKKSQWSRSENAAGTVYCPTTKTGVFLVRKAGCICFTGNTGRWSGDAGMSFHNLPKSPFFVRSDYTFELNKKILAEHDELFDAAVKAGTDVQIAGVVEILDLRGLITARPGMKLAPTDLAQIEPRVLNYTAGNFEILKEVSAGMAIYESHARRTMGWTGGNLKKENKPKYALAKVRVLSFGFGAGWEKAIVSALREKVDLTEKDDACAMEASVDRKVYFRVRDKATNKWVYNDKPKLSNVTVAPLVNEQGYDIEAAQKVVFIEKEHYRTKEKYLEAQTVYGQQARAEIKDFRSSNELITAQWDTLNTMLRDAIGTDLELELPSGRWMRYKDVKLSKRKVKDKETGEYVERTVLTVRIGGKRVVTYGSKLCENITQAIARDIFAHNMLLCEDAGIRTLFSVHDEIVPEVPVNFDSSIITKIMSTTPAWVPGLPVGAESKDSFRYIK